MDSQEDVKRRIAEAQELDRQAQLAQEGVAQAQYEMAQRLLQSATATMQSDAVAMTFLRKAAEQDHVKAQYGLGVMYLMMLEEKNALARKGCKGRPCSSDCHVAFHSALASSTAHQLTISLHGREETWKPFCWMERGSIAIQTIMNPTFQWKRACELAPTQRSIFKVQEADRRSTQPQHNVHYVTRNAIRTANQHDQHSNIAEGARKLHVRLWTRSPSCVPLVKPFQQSFSSRSQRLSSLGNL